jgi:GAF domain-containing protein
MYSTAFKSDESERLKELHQLRILDTPNELVYDNLTQLASDICETPIALISLIDLERTWFKSRVGYSDSQSSRHDTFCSRAIARPSPLIVEDASVHPEFKDHAQVVAVEGLRSYVGIPLITSNGFAVGVLCVLDRVPRKFTDHQVSNLKKLANQVVVLIELQRTNLHLLSFS